MTLDQGRRRLLGAGMTGAAVMGLPHALVRASTGTATATAPATVAPNHVRFALLGDNPYSEQAEAAFSSALAHAGKDSAFIIHVGDIKGGVESCSDDLLERRIALLEASPRPLMLTPGDDEWTDCSRLLAGAFDSLERLQWLRQRIYAQARPLGNAQQRQTAQVTLQFENQTQGNLLADPLDAAAVARIGLPEHQRWRAGPARFVTLNVPGSHLGFDSGIAADMIQAHARAASRWLEQSAALATQEGSPVLVIVLHAEFVPSWLGPDDFTSAEAQSAHPYAWFRQALYRTVAQFDGAVLLLHGDTHRFATDRPWRKLADEPALAALPTYGLPGALIAERLRRFARVRAIGSPAAASWIQVGITHQPEAAVPVELAVTPYLL